MSLRLFRRLLAFAITAFVVACFGWLAGFFYDARSGGVFQFDRIDFADSDTGAIGAFLASPDGGTMELSANDIRAFIGGLYARDTLAGGASGSFPMLPNVSLEGGMLRLGVNVSVPMFVFARRGEMAFLGKFSGGCFVLEYAEFGGARIPGFAARPLLERIRRDFSDMPAYKSLESQLSSLKRLEISGDKLVIAK